MAVCTHLSTYSFMYPPSVCHFHHLKQESAKMKTLSLFTDPNVVPILHAFISWNIKEECFNC